MKSYYWVDCIANNPNDNGRLGEDFETFELAELAAVEAAKEHLGTYTIHHAIAEIRSHADIVVERDYDKSIVYPE